MALRLYLVRWVDGDTDLLAATSEEDLFQALDAVGDPYGAAWTTYKGPLHLKLTLTNQGRFLIENREDLGSMDCAILETAFPLTKAENDREDDRDEDGTPQDNTTPSEFLTAMAADMKTWPPEGWHTCESRGLSIEKLYGHLAPGAQQ